MVGGYGVDTSSREEFAQEGYAVGGFLYGGIAFDSRSETVEIIAVKKEILRTGLGCDADTFGLGLLDHFQLIGGEGRRDGVPPGLCLRIRRADGRARRG